MFTERTNWGSEPNPLAQAVERMRAEQRPLLDLTETNPTRCGFRFLDLAPETALAQPAARHYAPHPAGLLATRAAIAAGYGAQGITLDPARLLLTAGTSEGYNHLMRLLLKPGEAMLVPSPSYPLLDFLARLNDVRLVPYPLHYDGRWWLDLDALRAAADDTCRVIVVISPNNPTGSYVKRREREGLEQFAAARGMAIIADEVFADFRLADDGDVATSFASGGPALTFALNGVSKLLGLPQMKLAWIATAGPAALADEAQARLEMIADTYLSVSTPAQLALPVWLQHRQTTQDEIRARLRANIAVARTLRNAQLLHVEGGWCAVLRLPRTQSDDNFALTLLEQDGVLIDPGPLFGFASEGSAVVSLLPPPDLFAEGLRRLDARAGG